jgi:hypothetical protein
VTSGHRSSHGLHGLLRAAASGLVIAGALGTAVAAAVLTPAATAGAAPIGDCTTTSGEIVVVDFAPWGGNIERGCAAKLTTGYAAMHEAGFTTVGVEDEGPAFICRIDNDPPPSQDPCITTPPPSAYWSYWHADVGQNTWSYSTVGAMSYHPPPGSVDAWVFGATDVGGTDGQPPFTPAQVRATNTGGDPTTTTPPPTTSPTTPPTTPTTIPSTAVTRSGSSSPGATGSGSKAASGPPARSLATSPPGSSSVTAPHGSTTVPAAASTPTTVRGAGHGPGSDGRSGPKIVDAVPVAAPGSSAGSPVPFVIGAIVVVALAGGGGVIAWRRRRAGLTGRG